MKFFDRFRKSKPATEVQKDGDTFTIPADSLMQVFNEPSITPAVNRLPGGALLVSMGMTTDQPTADLDELFRQLDDALAEHQPDILVSQSGRLSDAFAKSADVVALRAVFWALNPLVFTVWSQGAELLRRLLMRWVSDQSDHGVVAILYIQDAESAAGIQLASMLGELGFMTRRPDTDGAMFLYIKRADDLQIYCIVGRAMPPSGSRADWFTELCTRRRQIDPAADEFSVRRIDDELRQHLDAQLRQVTDAPNTTPYLATHLRKVAQKAADGGDVERKALLDCLASREAALLFIMNPETNTAPWTRLPDGGHALDVFPDMLMAHVFLVGDDPDASVPLGNLATIEVLEWMVREGAGLAIRIGDPQNPSRALTIGTTELAACLRSKKQC